MEFLKQFDAFRNFNKVNEAEVVIIGAGVSGLSAALELDKHGISWILLEKSDRPGGRIKTIQKNGFTLDAGFQVLHPNYPEVRNSGIWESLQFSSFQSGAYISRQKNLVWYGNPFLNTGQFIKSGFALPFQIREYPAAIRMFLEAFQSDENFQERKSEANTMYYLQKAGFSEQTIREFFVPFFGGVFLDPELRAGASYFLWLLKKFMQGKPGLPLGGMQSLPYSLAARLPASSPFHLHTDVKGIGDGTVHCSDGRRFKGRFILDAAGINPSRLAFRSTRNLYLFGPDTGHLPSALILNGNPEGSIMHFCFPSSVQPSYAPDGFALCSITLRNPEEEVEIEELKKELQLLFPALNWKSWSFLESFYIQKALPEFQSGPKPLYRREGNLFFSGDRESYSSINGAMRSGREAASIIASEIRGSA